MDDIRQRARDHGEIFALRAEVARLTKERDDAQARLAALHEAVSECRLGVLTDRDVPAWVEESLCEALAAAQSGDALTQLGQLLDECGATVTFQPDCRSGALGRERCPCERCCRWRAAQSGDDEDGRGSGQVQQPRKAEGPPRRSGLDTRRGEAPAQSGDGRKEGDDV